MTVSDCKSQAFNHRNLENWGGGVVKNIRWRSCRIAEAVQMGKGNERYNYKY